MIQKNIFIRLINKWPTPSKTAETLIVRQEGNETVFLNELKFQKNRALNLRRPLTDLNLPAVQAALGKKEFMEGVDYRGVPVKAYVCPIPNSPWFLVARIDTSEVYAPLREWFWAIIIFVIVLLIGLGTSIGLIWRNQRSKFYKERYQSTEDLLKLSRAVEQSPVSIIITDTKGDIEYINPKVTEVTGYQFAELYGKNSRIFSTAEKSKSEYKILWDTITSGKEWRGEFHNKKKNGELYWELASISPIINEKRKITHYLAVREDITEQKKNLDELVAAKEKAEEANRLKSNFLANMSHELRTPMIGILGYANILSSELKEPEQIEMTDAILKSGSRLTDTLNSILDLSRIESNKLDINLIPVNLLEILDESVNLYKPIAYSKGLYLNYSFSQKPVYIKSDKEILSRVFNNLINNAIKFTHNGGVTIKIFPPKNDSDKYIAVDIIDTGIGIPKEFNEVIFEPFRQVSDGFSRKFEGSGLGLSITKKFVELLAGSISFESTPGEGSTFTILFPLTKSNDEILVTGNKSSYVNETKFDKFSNKPSILLVEDNPVNASVIRAYLKDYASVDHFYDGSEGVAQCKVKLYDAVLMDINLKGIDGVEALNLIRQISEHYSKIPVIAITAYAMSGDKEKFLSLGFTHYLSKPFQRSELLSLLSEIFERPLLIS